MRLAIGLAATVFGVSSFSIAATRTLPLSASAQGVSADEFTFTIIGPADPVYSDYNSHTTTWAERHAVLEFDLSGLPRGAVVDAADFHFNVSDLHPRLVLSTLQYPSINFYGYAGNNVAEDADADRRDVSLVGKTINSLGPWTLELDADQIQIYANTHAAAVGIMAYPNSTDESIGFSTTGSDAPSIEITYTLFGDANLDDRINGDDYTLLDKGFALHLTGWSNGDFNGDGIIDQNDYLLIDQAFAAQGNPFSPDLLASRARDFGPDYVSALLATVPEPSFAAGLVAALLPLARRRRG